MSFRGEKRTQKSQGRRIKPDLTLPKTVAPCCCVVTRTDASLGQDGCAISFRMPPQI
jgi:hypothetical protein